MSLNGAKNNPKIVTKSLRSGQRGGASHKPPPPKYATVRVFHLWVALSLLFFVDPDMEINGKCYHDVLLSQQMLPVIKCIVDNKTNVSSTTDNAPA